MSDQYLEAAAIHLWHQERYSKFRDARPEEQNEYRRRSTAIIEAWVGDRDLCDLKLCSHDAYPHLSYLSCSQHELGSGMWCKGTQLVRVSVTEGEPTTSEVSIRDNLVVEGEPT